MFLDVFSSLKATYYPFNGLKKKLHTRDESTGQRQCQKHSSSTSIDKWAKTFLSILCRIELWYNERLDEKGHPQWEEGKQLE